MRETLILKAMQQLNKIINNTILTCLAIQIFSVSFSIAVSSIAFGIWGGLWIIQVLFIERKFNFDKPLFREIKWINYFIAFLILADLVSRIFAFYPEGALIGFKRNLLFLIFFVSIIKINDFETFRRILIINLIIVAVFSFLEIVYFGYYLREELMFTKFSEVRLDNFSHPITTAEIKMMFFLQFLPLLFLGKTYLKEFFIERKYLVAIFIPLLIAIFITQTRNVYIAVFVCILIYGFYFKWKFAVSFIILCAVLYFTLPNALTDRVRSIVDPTTLSAVSREMIWKNGWKIFKNNPVIGIGDNKVMEVYKFYKPDMDSTMEHSHLHSTPLMILATTGIIGALAFIGFFAALFMKMVRLMERSRNETIKQFIFGSILCLIGFLISGFTEWNFGDAEVFTVLIFMLSLPFVLFKIQRNEFNK